MPTPPAPTVFQLHVELRDIVPAVWRRVLAPGSVKLAKLHEYFQAGMGWTNSHMHYFGIGDDRYGAQFDEYPDGEINERDDRRSLRPDAVRRPCGQRRASRRSLTTPRNRGRY